MNLKVPCMIGHMIREHTYIDLKAPMNIMSRLYYNWIMNEKLKPRRDPYNPNRMSNFVERVRGLHVFVGDFVYRCDFMILEDVRGIIDQSLCQIVLGEPFVKTSKMTYNHDEGTITFATKEKNIRYRMPHKEERFREVEDLDVDNIPVIKVESEEERNIGGYKKKEIYYSKCLALGPEYRKDKRLVKMFETAFILRDRKT